MRRLLPGAIVVSLVAAVVACTGDDPNLKNGTTADGGKADEDAAGVAGNLLMNGDFESGSTACGAGWQATEGVAERVMVAKTGMYGCQICVVEVSPNEPQGGAATLRSSRVKVRKGPHAASAYVHASADGGGAKETFVDVEISDRMQSERSPQSTPTEQWLARTVGIEAQENDEIEIVLTLKGPVGACAVFDDASLVAQ